VLAHDAAIGIEPAERRSLVRPSISDSAGVKDPDRLGSYFDPFGDLTIRRALNWSWRARRRGRDR